MSFDSQSLRLLGDALKVLEGGFSSLPQCGAVADCAAMAEVLREVASRLHDNYPYHHPFYIGQMLKPPHPVARLAYALAMWINPNNHALDGGRASSAMEKEAVAEIARMFGWKEHLGHLCGGGTMANFEALWVSRQLHPGKGIAVSEQAHYTHARLSAVLRTPLVKVPADGCGRMDPEQLEAVVKSGAIGTVVATLGSTAVGAVDPLPAILKLRERYGFRVHVDAAYGGYFKLAGNLGANAEAAFQRIGEADSIVVDPHKHGLQPYGCGCVLFKNPEVGRIYQHDSPYTYFTSDELHLGEISLECSRPGAAAVGLWATLRLLPLATGGEFARMLEMCREAALDLYDHLQQDRRFAPLFPPELDIVAWAVRSPSARQSTRLARRVFDAAAERDVHLALATLPKAMIEASAPVDVWDDDKITCLRACAMKAEHRQWMPEIVARLGDAADAALGPGK
jgi:glutamate/tyrosine decarboxylase-like PLP-dependent enzyme